MKKILKPLSLILFLSLVLANSAVANTGSSLADDAEAVLPVIISTPVYEGNKNNQVAVLETDFPKAAFAFSKMYAGAESPVWFKHGKTLYVYFKNGGKRTSAVLSLKGNFIYAITDLDASALPEKITETVLDAYTSYSVVHAWEIKVSDFTVHKVLLENCNRYIIVQAEGEELIEIERMQKVFIPAQNKI